ncbi:MAG: hypothetical protein EBU90_31645 [Proteobacteria bacterium]|nr:hypothetical protein [Pseudomonadota bacterium]
MEAKKMKPKKCKECNKEFEPHKYATSKTKCQDCIKAFDKAKAFKRLKKQIEKPLKERKPIKVKPDTKAIALSKFIKERDAGKPCISCGKIMQDYEIQAGHYIARGQSVKLKYEPRNIHAQCWNCNNNHQRQQETKKGFTNGLIARYGIEYVEWLEDNK